MGTASFSGKARKIVCSYEQFACANFTRSVDMLGHKRPPSSRFWDHTPPAALSSQGLALRNESGDFELQVPD